MTNLQQTWTTVLASLAGLAWIAGILLVSTQADSDPVGDKYDPYNRLLTPALILLPICAFIFRQRVEALGLPGIMPLTIALAGLTLYLAGNLIEFWGAWLADKPSETAAEATGADHWGLSLAGFLVFLVGEVITVGSMIAFAVRLGRWPTVGLPVRIVVGVSGALLSVATALWAVSPLAALVPAVLFAFAWLVVANVVTTAPGVEGHRGLQAEALAPGAK